MAKFRFTKSTTLNYKMHERFIIPTIKVGWATDDRGIIFWVDMVIWKWEYGINVMCGE